MLSVVAAILGAAFFCGRCHVRFETALSPWRDPSLVGVFVGGRSIARGKDLSFLAVGIGGLLRTVPSEDEALYEKRSSKPFRKAVSLGVQVSKEGSVWCEDLLFKRSSADRRGFLLLLPMSISSLSSLRIVSITAPA